MTTSENWATAVFELIQDYCGDIEEDVTKIVKDVSKEAAKRLRESSPKSNRRQKKVYAKGWKTDVEPSATYVKATIYNDTKPGLAHILEFGRDAGETNGHPYPSAPAFPHIQKIEDWAADEVINRLMERL